MRIWTGKLRLLGRATRGQMGGPRKDGEEVTVRVVATDGPYEKPTVDVDTGKDVMGVTRWRAAVAGEFDPWAVLRALAMTQPETEPEKA